ncbi:selenocysteine-specific translation elongation factor [soil metagenome]
MIALIERILGTAGHIDHGKTALVRALTGIDTDRLPAEKRRGITIDLGFAALDLGGVRLGLIDVPGHERFVRNMLAGATGFDLALLVVAADDSVMPQTREHLEILRLLGIPGGVVALTKCDLVDDDWLEIVEEDVRSLLANTCLQSAPILRTSSATGQGIDDLKAALQQAAEAVPSRADPGLFRLSIDRSFTVPGHGAVVTGTIASGRVAVGDDLQWWPDGRPVRVRGLRQHDQAAETLPRGARAALNLSGLHHSEIERGQELATPGYLEATRVMSVELLASAEAPRPLRHRARYRLHIGTADVSATLSILEGPELLPGTPGTGQLFLAAPVVAVHGQAFVLRAESPPQTLGGGRVLQPVARRIRRRDTHSRQILARLAGQAPRERVAAALAALGLQPWTDRSLCRDTGLPPETLRTVLDELAEAGALIELPIGSRRSIRLLSEVIEDLEDRLIRAVGRLHLERPRASAVGRSRLGSELADLRNEPLVHALIERLGASGALTVTSRSVARKDHAPKLSQAERRLKQEIAEAYQAGGLTPPDLPELSTQAGPRAAIVPELIGLLVEEERLVEITRDLYLDANADAELRRKVVERLASGQTMTMADLRDLLQTTRKYAVPFGEYLDRIGLTVREGDLRRLGPDH